MIGAALFVFLVWSAAAGPDNPGVNPAFGMVFVLLWVGLVPASLLLGPVIRALSPVRAVHLGICRVLGRSPDAAPIASPTRVGCWSAAATLLALTWLRLVSPTA